MPTGADRNQQRHRRRPHRQGNHDPQGVLVGPVEIVEDDGDRAKGGGPVDDPEHGVEDAEAHLAGQWQARVVELVLPGEDAADTGGLGILGRGVQSECLGQGAEGPGLRHLVAPPAVQLEAGVDGAVGERGQQGALADAGVARTTTTRPRPAAASATAPASWSSWSSRP